MLLSGSRFVQRVVVCVCVCAVAVAGCRDARDAPAPMPPPMPPFVAVDASIAEPAGSPASSAVSVSSGPVRTEDVPVPGDRPAVVVRGARAHRVQMLFIPGMCVHPGGYVMAFQHTAAARGDLLAVQGDVSCGGDGSMRRWSGDLAAMDRRIEAAFQAAGFGEPREVIVIGYSQGAERAQRLVARWPAKYSSAVLMASPIDPTPKELARANAVVLMAGTFDAQARMRNAVGSLRRASIPVTFLEIPGARHGQMGTDPERTMAAALDFVEAQRTSRGGSTGADAAP